MSDMCNYLECDLCCERFEVLEAENERLSKLLTKTTHDRIGEMFYASKICEKLKKREARIAELETENEKLGQGFNAGVAQAVGWMTAEFEFLNDVNCPELLEKVLADLGVPK